MGEASTLARRTAGDIAVRVLGALFAVLVVAGVAFARISGQAVPWLATNLFLAALGPLGFTLLFAVRRRRVGWWTAAAASVLLLPNTPYLLTDVIHFHDDQRIAAAMGLRPWVVPGTYLVVVAAAVCGYAYTLARLIADVRFRHSTRVALVIALAVNALCAAGVWLGRVGRLNSWDVAHPHVVASTLSRAAAPRPLLDMGVVFVGAGAAAFTLLYVVAAAARHVLPARDAR